MITSGRDMEKLAYIWCERGGGVKQGDKEIEGDNLGIDSGQIIWKLE